MPLTPFHFGPALLFGLLFFSCLDLPTFIVANAILDLEPLAALVLGLEYPLHGFFHSFVGASIIALALAPAMMKLAPTMQKSMKALRLEQEFSWKSVLLASFSGVYLHILLDAPLYGDIRPFWPYSENPLAGAWNTNTIQIACILLFAFGAAVYIYCFVKRR